MIKIINIHLLLLFFSQHLSNKFKHIFYFLSPQMQCANCISLRMMVTCFACMAHKFVSLNTPTRYASEASCNAKTAILWNCRSVLCSCAILWTKHWKAIDVSYTLGIVHIEVTTWAPTYINCSWTVSSDAAILIPPADGTAALAAFVANCFTEALPPVDFLAVCFVLSIMKVLLF